MNKCAMLPAFKALADETRLRLLRLLIRFELNVGELVGVLGLGQSRISRHLRILVDCGLITARRDGLWVFYQGGQASPAKDFLAGLNPYFADCGPAEDLTKAEAALAKRAQETRRFFNAIATDWRTMRREVLGDLDLEGLICAHVPRCHTAVDLGCGPGELLPALAVKAENVIGVDGAPAMLEQARAKVSADKASLRLGQLEHLPMADAEAQAAVISLTLHHLSDPLAALGEAARVLAPGARLVVVDFLKHEVESMRGRFGDHWLGFTPEDMSAWLTQAGFFLETTEIKPVRLGLELGVYVARRPSMEENT
jgi:ArsR family transcriptional regulator